MAEAKLSEGFPQERISREIQLELTAQCMDGQWENASLMIEFLANQLALTIATLCIGDEKKINQVTTEAEEYIHQLAVARSRATKNRIVNLREATPVENQRNRRFHSYEIRRSHPPGLPT